MADADNALERALRISPEAIDPAGLTPVEVAILDSGVDASHPDLAGRVARAFRFEEKDGRQQPVEMSVMENNDTFGHGTGVAGIIARHAPHARLIDVRILGSANKGTGEALVAALRLAIREGWKLINMSLASPARFAPDLMRLCEEAHYRGQVVVAARRNMPVSDEGFPAEFSSCIGVDTARFESPFHYFFRDGPIIEMRAMGEDVLTAAPNRGYTRLTGTSFATPMVSALCARILGQCPALRPFEVRSVLRAHAMPEPTS
jgi:subtilisin family serine protease